MQSVANERPKRDTTLLLVACLALGTLIGGTTILAADLMTLDDGATLRLQVKDTGATEIMADDPNKAAFTVTSTNGGIRPPRLTLTQRQSILSPGSGVIIFNTDTGLLNVFDGSRWCKLTCQDASPPALTTAMVDDTLLELTYTEPDLLDTGSVPAPGDYLVKVDGGAGPAISSVVVGTTKVTLTLTASVGFGTAVTLSYTPAANPIKDTVANLAAPLVDTAVTNVSLNIVTIAQLIEDSYHVLRSNNNTIVAMHVDDASAQLSGFTVHEISLWLKNQSTGLATVGVFDAGNPPTLLHQFGTIDVAGLGGSFEKKTFSDGSYTLGVGHRIGIQYTASASEFHIARKEGGAIYDGQKAHMDTRSIGSWAHEPDNDLKFELKGVAP